MKRKQQETVIKKIATTNELKSHRNKTSPLLLPNFCTEKKRDLSIVLADWQVSYEKLIQFEKNK